MAKLRVASLFCGCGGTDYGMLGGFQFLNTKYAKNSLKIVYANDIEPTAAAIFKENFRQVNFEEGDIRKIPATKIPDHDILTGGFPCKSFSIVAQNPPRLGCKDENGQLFFEMCRILKRKKPNAFIAENVKGIISANSHRAFPLILEEFEKCGYIIAWCVLNAADFGVPQRRERVFIVGIRKSIGKKFYPPEPTHNKNGDLICEKWEPLKAVIFDHKEVDKKYFFSEKAHKGLLKSNPTMNKGRAQNINNICNTVGAHLAKVSLNSTDPVLKVNGKFRRFTPREVARIQSFPDEFILVGSDSAQYKALGNAVPPVLIWHVTKRLIDILKGNKNLKDTRTEREKRSHNMAQIRSKGTILEKQFNLIIKGLGKNPKKNDNRLPGKPDIVFEKERLVVFCDSDFWHGKDYPDCVERIKTNKRFWRKKIEQNMARDKKVTVELKNMGWKVTRFWERDIKTKPEVIRRKLEKYLIP